MQEMYIMRIFRVVDPGYEKVKMVKVKKTYYRESVLQSNRSGEEII